MIVFLLIANVVGLFATWYAARQVIWVESKILLGAVTAQDTPAAAQGFRQYLATTGTERTDLAADSEQAMEAAGYSYSASKYVKSRLSKELLPILICALAVEAALIAVVLYRLRHNDQRITSLRRKLAEAEEQRKNLESNREALIQGIDHYEENLYHQLKTPLTSLQLCLEQLPPQAPQDKQVYETAKMQLQKLSRLITLFLRNKRLSSNQIKFHYKLAALDSIVEDAVRQLQQQATFHHITVCWKLQDGDFSLPCDETWLSECIITLLENAIEHSPEHGTVRISLYHEKGRYRLQILSSGILLDLADLPQIFERYYSGSPGHFGIGLHMARTIAENHHGHIVAYNAEGDEGEQGVCFDLVLPILDRAETYDVTKL